MYSELSKNYLSLHRPLPHPNLELGVLVRDTEKGYIARLPAQCPGCWAMRTNEVKKKCVVKKILFCTGLTSAAKAGQKNYCIDNTSPMNHKEGPFHMYSKSLDFPQFQQLAGATPLWSLWIWSRLEPLSSLKRQLSYQPARLHTRTIYVAWRAGTIAVFCQLSGLSWLK
jgi:hypothetical protein